jgi:alkylation response protein AidB-like acyl-CoA dehydrogenase
MQFGLSSEQLQFESTLDRFLAAQSSVDQVRAHVAGDLSVSARVWSCLADLGVTGLVVPEAHGGLGLSMVDAALASEAQGRHAAPAPFLSSIVLAPLALGWFGSAAQQVRWLPRLAAGEVRAGLALSERTGARSGAGVRSDGGRLSGRSVFVLDPGADILVVSEPSGALHLVERDAPGMRHLPLETVDGTRDVGEVAFDNVPATALSGGGDADPARRLVDAGRVMVAADTLGAAQSMLDKAVAYARQREQFGRPIGSFQAVKHMCAEMAAALEPCRALVWYAAHALDALPEEASLIACHAKAHLSEVGTRVARTATEVHGGMGFTDLLGLHYWFKRIGFNRQILGGPQGVRADAARLKGYAA